MCIVKKTISFLLVFCLFAFSLFSTGCGSSGGFKFLGAVVAIAVIASSGGTASPAVFAANVRGGVASTTTISATKTKVKVYNLDDSAPDLRGTEISDIAATFVDNKLSCTTGDVRLQVGDYLFEVYNTDSKKVFLRAILHVDGFSNDLKLDISPVTEIKTAVYKEWVAKAPADTSVKNFELNLTAALEKEMTPMAHDYAETLATWDQADDIVGTVEVSDIDVPTATKVKVTVTNNPIPGTTRPAYFQSANWRTITAADIVEKQFGMRYILDTDTNTWIKFTNTDTDTHKLPIISFTDYESDRSGYYYMGGHGYTEETMNGWEPKNNEFEINVDWNEFTSSIYKVSSDSKDSKIEVIDFDIDNDTLLDEEKLIYDARITDYNGKKYLHIKDMYDQEIYELMPQQPYGSVR